MRLDERVEADFVRVAVEARGGLVVEVAENEECRVRARFAHLPEMFLGREEPLCEQRQLGHGARCAEVVEASCEPLVDQHRDCAGSAALVRRDDVLDPRIRPDVAH